MARRVAGAPKDDLMRLSRYFLPILRKTPKEAEIARRRLMLRAVRPRFGVMRSREFLMKDAYSFDLDANAGRHSYNKMFVANLPTFARLGLTAIPMAAESGPIGGDLSHEFIILTAMGESEVYRRKDFLQFAPPPASIDVDDAAALEEVVGPKGLAEGKVEVKCRRSGDHENLSPQDAAARVIVAVAAARG